MTPCFSEKAKKFFCLRWWPFLLFKKSPHLYPPREVVWGLYLNNFLKLPHSLAATFKKKKQPPFLNFSAKEHSIDEKPPHLFPLGTYGFQPYQKHFFKKSALHPCTARFFSGLSTSKLKKKKITPIESDRRWTLAFKKHFSESQTSKCCKSYWQWG